jgi:hypothetical protein
MWSLDFIFYELSYIFENHSFNIKRKYETYW